MDNIFDRKSQEVLFSGIINSKNSDRIRIFDNQYKIIIQMLLGNKIFPTRVFLDLESKSLFIKNHESWENN